MFKKGRKKDDNKIVDKTSRNQKIVDRKNKADIKEEATCNIDLSAKKINDFSDLTGSKNTVVTGITEPTTCNNEERINKSNKEMIENGYKGGNHTFKDRDYREEVCPKDTRSLVEKYRPTSLEDILGNREVIRSLINCSKNMPNLLLYGPPGTGKTTAILSIAKQLYSNTTGNVLELNASNERGIGTVREKIKSFGMAQSFNNLKKMIILDEADSLSKDAQNALRRVMEDYSHNVRFCLIANYANKIIPAILSRCCKFRFLPLKNTEIAKRMKYICEQEGISMSQQELDTLMLMAKGDLRSLINTLDGLRNPVVNTSLYESTLQVQENDGLTSRESSFGDIKTKDNKIEINHDLLTPQSNQQGSIDISLLDCQALLKLSHTCPARAYSFLDNFLQNNDFFIVFEQLVTYLRNKNMAQDTSIFRTLADIEYRIAIGGNENVQIKCLIGVIGELRIDDK